MINFPNSPTLDQVYTTAAGSWRWDGVRWVAVIGDEAYVFLDDAQTLTNKTISAASNTLIGVEPSITKSTGYAKWNGSTWVFLDRTFVESESDPVFSASAAADISSTDKSNWSDAYSWGNHGAMGYVVGPSSSSGGTVVTFDGSTGKLIRAATYFDSPAIAIPAAPAADTLRYFARSRAGRVLLHTVGPAGIDTALQPALFGNSTYMWLPGNGATLAINWGTSWTARNSGTSAAQSQPTLASTNALASLNRANFSTGTTSTGSSGIQSTTQVVWRGNSAGLGGFFFFARFAVDTLQAAAQYMIGLSALNSALTGEPSAQANSLLLCKDSTDSNWFFASRDASAVTKTATGVAVTAGVILDFTMFAAPNSNKVTFRLANSVTGEVLVDNTDVSANLPVNTTFLYCHAQCRSTTGTTSKVLALNRIYIESDL